MTIDAHVQTSVTWTYFLLGEYDLAIESDIGSPPFCALIARFLQKTMGSASIREIEARAGSPTTRLAVGVYADLFEGRVDDALEKLEAMRGRGFADPEGWYIYGFALANAGAPTPALELVRRAVEGGYACHEPLVRRAEWNPLRGRADFEEIVARTAAMVADARQRFEAADGAGALRIE
jgi:hypothetical protein